LRRRYPTFFLDLIIRIVYRYWGILSKDRNKGLGGAPIVRPPCYLLITYQGGRMITDEYPWGTNEEYTCQSIDNDDIGLLNAWYIDNMEWAPCPECGVDHSSMECEEN